MAKVERMNEICQGCDWRMKKLVNECNYCAIGYCFDGFRFINRSKKYGGFVRDVGFICYWNGAGYVSIRMIEKFTLNPGFVDSNGTRIVLEDYR